MSGLMCSVDGCTWMDYFRYQLILIPFCLWNQVDFQGNNWFGLWCVHLVIMLYFCVAFFFFFFSISTEFLALMKKVTSTPRILDIVNMQGAQRLLERLADMLGKIQKALGEYLERERNSFPRFYFVGDEDLLEIMGNRYVCL